MVIDMAGQCDVPDRSWLGEMWFPVENRFIRSSPLSPVTLFQIQQTLTLNKDIVNQNYISPSRKFETQHMHYLIVELHMCYFQDTCFQEELDPSK